MDLDPAAGGRRSRRQGLKTHHPSLTAMMDDSWRSLTPQQAALAARVHLGDARHGLGLQRAAAHEAQPPAALGDEQPVGGADVLHVSDPRAIGRKRAEQRHRQGQGELGPL